ncbi:MAG: hypothetical protein IVW57_15155 [Ktedonobacterales bacterium]|nr:hypothetical protein [Ktedonobacterales bacterium]
MRGEKGAWLVLGAMRDAFQRDWLLALLVGWALLLFGGLALGRPDRSTGRRMPRWTRLTSSLALAIAGWSWLAFARTAPTTLALTLLALGMTLGLLGDLSLAGPLPARAQSVLGGMLAFGLGHVAYSIGLLVLGGAVGARASAARWVAWAAWLLVALVGWSLVVARGRTLTPPRRLALPYALLLASTAGVATGLALQAPVFVPVALGAALFLASDLLLAAQLFNGLAASWVSDAVWLLYGPAQFLIIYGAGVASLSRLSG